MIKASQLPLSTTHNCHFDLVIWFLWSSLLVCSYFSFISVLLFIRRRYLFPSLLLNNWISSLGINKRGSRLVSSFLVLTTTQRFEAFWGLFSQLLGGIRSRFINTELFYSADNNTDNEGQTKYTNCVFIVLLFVVYPLITHCRAAD